MLKYLLFISRSDFLKKISRGDVIRTHMNFPGEDIILLKEHIKFSRRTKYITGTHLNFLGEAKCKNTSKFRGELSKFCKNTYDFLEGENIVRTDQIFLEIFSKIFQKSFLKILQEQIRFSRRPYPQEQIFCKIALLDAFV